MTDTANKVKTFPAPRPLATPNDLPDEAIAKITEHLNSIVADAFALYTKTKNFHWHLSGARFRDIHLLLDEQAEEILAFTYPLAERVRRIGGTTIRSISHINALQTIDDDNDEIVQPDEMLRRLMEDNKHLARTQREAHSVADENEDAATAGLLEDVIDATEKRTWFLFEYLQDTDRFFG